ncbi:glycoside hydrolase family 75 protein [Streptomyces indicus]|uniref:Chitosanase of glycosyl hydrolase group 75 n=1 Tax=Streptomyces indicus TaxID=417292 RepID=A0A1G8UTT0_9ACTN|nr:glycoside hydrolase family 75 protein [Streptomyces indicus]SDJ57286.1 chitosanase of glycosyl hydrolase group 75 [Streptomyces indicus]
MRAVLPAVLAPVLLAAALPPASAQEGSVAADALLSKVRDCRPVSAGRFRTDAGARADIPVCGGKGVVFWKADLDIDCDGRPSRACSKKTDPYFQPTTAFQDSAGRQLDSAALPYVVVPGASKAWDHRKWGVHGGGVVAVIYRGKVQYAVVGDTGPTDLIGEASYATARALGIDPHPVHGGADGGATYIFFRDSRVRPIESHREAVRLGQALARQFVNGG